MAKFYSQAVGGQLEIFQKQKPIEKVLAQPGTPGKLKTKLELILEARRFAEKELGLDPDGHYLRYADLGREHVVWNVHAAPEFSMEPKAWWYPFVGSAKYRGYFTEKDAENYAEKLRRKGYDVYVGGVDAYSKLGWFKDPVLNTFVYDGDTALIETIFHELAHQRLFISGDSDFNEAFATAVGEEGVRRWLATKSDSATREKYLQSRARKEQFIQLVRQTRDRLEALYNQAAADNKPGLSDVELRDQKRRIIAGMRETYEKLKAEWNGFAGYDHWFEGPLNNAQLNTVSLYYDLVPAFRSLLTQHDGDLERFYDAVEAFGKMKKDQRHDALKALMQATSTAAPNPRGTAHAVQNPARAGSSQSKPPSV